MLDALKAPFVVAEQDVYLSASIGIAMIPPGATAEEVIRDADAAMYRAKSEGRNRHALFDSTLHEAALTRLDIETRLRRGLDVEAINGSGLGIAYQPIAHAADGRLHGFEALARWRDADGRTMTPDEFIPVAEETGLIAALGRLVLREACRQLACWRDVRRRLGGPDDGRQHLRPPAARARLRRACPRRAGRPRHRAGRAAAGDHRDGGVRRRRRRPHRAGAALRGHRACARTSTTSAPARRR